MGGPRRGTPDRGHHSCHVQCIVHEARVFVSGSHQLALVVSQFCYPLKLADKLLEFLYKCGTVYLMKFWSEIEINLSRSMAS